jgi:hypothetical protein
MQAASISSTYFNSNAFTFSYNYAIFSNPASSLSSFFLLFFLGGIKFKNKLKNIKILLLLNIQIKNYNQLANLANN